MNRQFVTTRWTLVLQASSLNEAERREALTELLSQNWYPLYAFLRRSGKAPQEAEDLIQGFCLHVIEKNVFAGRTEHRRSRFRSFLLKCLKNFMANEWSRQQAAKRGGGRPSFSLDFSSADQRYQREPSHSATAERAFDRAWAIELIERSLQQLAAKWAESGKQAEFEILKTCLLGTEQAPRQEVADRLGVSTNTLKVTIHRLKAEFRKELCLQVADTLDRDDLLEDEISFLFSSLSL